MFFSMSTADKLATFVFLFGGLFLLWYEFSIILPTYNLTETEEHWHFILAMILAVSIYWNWFKLVADRQVNLKTGKQSKEYNSALQAVLASNRLRGCGISNDGDQNNALAEGCQTHESSQVGPLTGDPWNLCVKCNIFTPPRSYHCKMCNICILKRDHHCFFAGCCVGHYNQRYFVVMIFYCWLVGVYCNYMNFEFNGEQLGGYSWGTFNALVMPHLKWMMGYYTLYQLAIALLMSAGWFLSCILTYILYTQCVQIYHGQTGYERKIKVDPYNLGPLDNVREVLGKRWYLVWLCPLVKSELPGNGFQFRKLSDKQE